MAFWGHQWKHPKQRAQLSPNTGVPDSRWMLSIGHSFSHKPQEMHVSSLMYHVAKGLPANFAFPAAALFSGESKFSQLPTKRLLMFLANTETLKSSNSRRSAFSPALL